MRVPGEPFHGRTADSSPPWQVSSAPSAASCGRDCSVTWATLLIDASASPRKPTAAAMSGGAEGPGSRLPPAPFLHLPLQSRRLDPERLARRREVPAGGGERRPNAVLLLPVLDHPVQRPLADAQQPRRLLAVARGPLQRSLDEVPLHFRQ